VRNARAFEMPNTIQPGEDSMGGGLDGISHNSDGDPKLLGVNRNGDDLKLNAYYDRPDNRWNRDNGFAFAVSQLSSFLLSRFLGGVLFGKLAVPSAEHPADLTHFLGKSDIFFVV